MKERAVLRKESVRANGDFLRQLRRRGDSKAKGAVTDCADPGGLSCGTFWAWPGHRPSLSRLASSRRPVSALTLWHTEDSAPHRGHKAPGSLAVTEGRRLWFQALGQISRISPRSPGDRSNQDDPKRDLGARGA